MRSISKALKEFIESHRNLLDSDILTLMYHCPRSMRKELLQILSESNIVIPQSQITMQSLLNVIKSWKRSSDGQIVVRNGSIRYTSYEDDFSAYDTLENLLRNVHQDYVPVQELEDNPSLLQDYFSVTIHCRTADECDAYEYNKLILNQKYLGTSVKTTFDGSWIKYGVKFKNIDHPNWVYKITSPDPDNPVDYDIQTANDYVWYNKATPATRMEFLPQHNTACRASVFDKLMRAGKLQIL